MLVVIGILIALQINSWNQDKPLLIHPDFEDYLFQMISYTSYTNEQSEGVKEKIEIIVAMIEKEVEK